MMLHTILYSKGPQTPMSFLAPPAFWLSVTQPWSRRDQDGSDDNDDHLFVDQCLMSQQLIWLRKKVVNYVMS